MHRPEMIVAAYGIWSLVGGAIGYVKAKSVPSLVAGSVSGALLLVCAYGIAQGSRLSALGSLVIALALGARFVGTWLKKRRLMPDLLMILFSAATVLAVVVVLVKR